MVALRKELANMIIIVLEWFTVEHMRILYEYRTLDFPITNDSVKCDIKPCGK